MISDKERRRIANELREAASAKGKRSGSMELMLSKLLGIAKQDRGVFGQPVDVAATWRDVYRSLADLIDRPTCKALYYDTEGLPCESYEAIKAQCGNCGHELEWVEANIYGSSCKLVVANYCHNCGAEVVE